MDELYRTLISTLLTPINIGAAVGTAWILRKGIRDIVNMTGLTEVEFTTKGVKGKFDSKRFAEEAYRKQGMGPPSAEDVKEVTTLVQSLRPFVAGRRILWVDNHPANNQQECSALVSWGVEVQTRRSTEEALTELREVKSTALVQEARSTEQAPVESYRPKDQPFDLVISDWFRGHRPEGERLANMMRSESINVPLLFYFMANGPSLFEEIKNKARTIHAVGATSSPRELLRWTFAELVRAALRDPSTSFGQ